MVRRAKTSDALPAHRALGLDHARLLFNFLRISPSYALICQAGGQKITQATPDSSKLVIYTFRKYGDVYRIPYEHWPGSGLAMSGKTTVSEQPLLIHPGQSIQCPDSHDGFLIPCNLQKEEKLLIAKGLIDQLPAPLRGTPEPIIRSKTLWRALAAVYQKAKHPEIELWRIGLLANLVERFTGRIDPWCKKKLARDAEMRRHLTLMAARAILIALLVSENAAQGSFPVRTPVVGEQLEFAFAEQKLHALLSAQGDAEYLTVLERAACLI